MQTNYGQVVFLLLAGFVAGGVTVPRYLLPWLRFRFPDFTLSIFGPR